MHNVAIEAARRTLEAGKAALRASSCTFYIRDPWWADEFLLLFMPGVKIVEPMYGFLSTGTAIKLVNTGQDEAFIEDAGRDSRLRGDATTRGINKAKLNMLFGDFVQRESVASCACMQHRCDNNDVHAILFVNFDQRCKFDEHLQRSIRQLMHALVADLPEIGAEVASKTPSPFVPLVRVLRPTQQLPMADTYSVRSALDGWFTSILAATFDAFGMRSDSDLGTIHLVQTDTQKLTLEAHVGKLDKLVKSQDIDKQEGVITWVARRRKAILIHDMEQSPFRNIHIEVKKHIRSELAVPMFAGDDLVGVLNLESDEPNKFSPHAVRTTSYAADLAAIAWRLFTEASFGLEIAERSQGLLDLCVQAVTNEERARSALRDLALLAAKFLACQKCEIWRFDRQSGRFEDVGASYDVNSLWKPRGLGWSRYVRDTACPVWIDNVQSQNQFGVHYWSFERRRWHKKPPNPQVPRSLNAKSSARGMQGEMGLPIVVRSEVIGVAWVRYGKELEGLKPSSEAMDLARGFAGQAGLVIDCLERHTELLQQRSDEIIKERIQKSLFPTGNVHLEGLDVHIISRPCGSKIGGDFHAAVRLDKTTAAFILGDAVSHGTIGALSMLPLVTAFRLFYKESRSPNYLIEKLAQVATELEISGTVTCFTITQDSNARYLFASSAGHDDLIILKPNSQYLAFPNEVGPSKRPSLGVPYDAALGVDWYPLSSGDLVIGFTDGVREAGENQRGTQFSRSGILRIALEHLEETPAQIASAIESTALDLSNGKFDDDVTIIVLRVT